ARQVTGEPAEFFQFLFGMVDFRLGLLKCDFPLELFFFLKHIFQSLKRIAMNPGKITTRQIGALLRFPFLVIEALALGFNPVKASTLLAPGLCQCCPEQLERRRFKHPKDLTQDIAIELIADKMGTRFRLPRTTVTGTLVPVIIDAEQLLAQLTAE